jgi:iron complex outermembrane receptor protein
VLALGGGACVAAEASAQAKSDDMLNLSLEELTQIEIPTVVGASKYEQKANVAPASITVVSAEEIRRFGWLTLADILRSVRGFYVTDNRNYSFLGVRGFSRPGDYNSRVLVLLDGNRINDSIYGQGSIGGEFAMDVDLIDRVEIIRGPGSSLYGTGAFFGVVNVIPKRGKDLSGGELVGGLGDRDTALGRASYGKKFANDLDMLVSVSGYRSDNISRYVQPQLSGDASRNFGVSLGADGEQWHSAYASMQYKGLTVAAVAESRRKDLPAGIYDTTLSDDRNFSLDEHQHVDAQYKHAFSGGAELFTRLYYNQYDYRSDFVFVDDPSIINKDIAKSNWWGAEAKWSKLLAKRHLLTLGAEYVDYTKSARLNVDVGDPGNPYVDFNKPFSTWAGYVQDEWALTNKLTLNAGVRYDRHYRGETSTSPRLALIWNPSTDTVLKLLYGTAFRSPNQYELLDSSLGFVLNPNLKAERIHTTEVVVEHSLKKNLRAIASIYQYKISDLVDVEDIGGGDVQFNNIGQVKAKGLDLELQGKWQWLDARASYSYQIAEDDAGQTLSNAPKHLFKANLAIPFQQNYSLGIELLHVAARNNHAGDNVGGYSLANLNFVARNVVRNLDASIGVFNLFDKDYSDPTSKDDVTGLLSLPQDGRRVRAKLVYRF